MAQRTYLQGLAKRTFDWQRYVSRYRLNDPTVAAALGLTTAEQTAINNAYAGLQILLQIPFRQQP